VFCDVTACRLIDTGVSEELAASFFRIWKSEAGQLDCWDCKVEEARFYETSVTIYQFARRYNTAVRTSNLASMNPF
jgi:hypothetical protein